MKKMLLTLLLIGTNFFLQKVCSQTVSDKEATALLVKNSAALNLTQAEIANSRISASYKDALSGAILVYLQQTIEGIDVERSIKTLAFKNEKLISASGNRVIPLYDYAGSNVSKVNMTTITAFDALTIALNDLKIPVPPFPGEDGVASELPAKETDFGKMGIATQNIKAKLIWVNAIGGLQLCWAVDIFPSSSSDTWRIKINANTGKIIGKDNHTLSCNFNDHTETITETRSSQTNPFIIRKNLIKAKIISPLAVSSSVYNVLPYPVESPNFGTPALQTNPWELSPAGSPATTLKWHSNGINDFDSTIGNNVWARIQHGTDEEMMEPNTVVVGRSTTSLPDLTFNSTADFTKVPNIDSSFQAFSVANLFYWNNIIHDLSYQYGFDEPSGNFQANNLNRGGLADDYVYAYSQFGNGTPQFSNNAQFSTWIDGTRPVMQMFLFNQGPSFLDGALDNGVVTHEYTHGISIRFTGGPNAGSCLENNEQLGEGWSDYVGLMATTDWAAALPADGKKARGIGTYVVDQPGSGRGIRTYPYSTDLTIDPWNYGDIEKTNGEVHALGEIWCSALWDMTWNIIKTDGINTNLFQADAPGGNSVAMKLIFLGMKLQPCSPGFIDGRDAILKADTLLYNGKYSCAIWQAFAGRGMGVNASQGSSDIVGDEKADNNLAGVIITKQVNKLTAFQNDKITYSFTVSAKSICGNSIPQNLSITDTLSPKLNYVSGGNFNEATRTVSFNGINLSNGESRTYSFVAATRVGSYFPPVTLLNDPADKAITPLWDNTSTANAASIKWRPDSLGVVVSTPFSIYYTYSYFAIDTIVATDRSLATIDAFIPPGQPTTLQFENVTATLPGIHGGVVEISVDNGINWEDLGPYMSGLTYQTTILADMGSPIAGRKAFSGQNAGFFGGDDPNDPNSIPIRVVPDIPITYIDLSAFEGKKVKIRFRYCTSDFFDLPGLPRGLGWNISNIKVSATPIILNTARLVDANNILLETTNTVETVINEEKLSGIVWHYFTATKQANKGLLEWGTSQEVNAAEYIAERSIDGVYFTAIGKVPAAGTGTNATESKYDLIDDNPLVGIVNFYRIKAVDKNGNITYSEIRTLIFPADNSVIISPNPAKDKLAVDIPGNNETLQIYLVDALGQTMKKYTMKGQHGQLVLPTVSAGVYVLKIVHQNGYITGHKVVIQ